MSRDLWCGASKCGQDVLMVWILGTVNPYSQWSSWVVGVHVRECPANASEAKAPRLLTSARFPQGSARRDVDTIRTGLLDAVKCVITEFYLS